MSTAHASAVFLSRNRNMITIFGGLFCKGVYLITVFVSGSYEYKSYTTVHPKSVAARTTHTYYERNKGKPLYVGNLTWVGLMFFSCLRSYAGHILPVISYPSGR